MDGRSERPGHAQRGRNLRGVLRAGAVPAMDADRGRCGRDQGRAAGARRRLRHRRPGARGGGPGGGRRVGHGARSQRGHAGDGPAHCAGGRVEGGARRAAALSRCQLRCRGQPVRPDVLRRPGPGPARDAAGAEARRAAGGGGVGQAGEQPGLCRDGGIAGTVVRAPHRQRTARALRAGRCRGAACLVRGGRPGQRPRWRPTRARRDSPRSRRGCARM